VKKLLVLLVLVGLGVWGAVAYHRHHGTDDAVETKFETESVKVERITEKVPASGPVEARGVQFVGSSASGEVVFLNPKADFNLAVNKGDVLVELDKRVAELKLKQAQAARAKAEAGKAEAEAQLKAARRAVAIQEEMEENKVGQKRVMMKAQADRDVAQAAVKVAEAQIAEANEVVAQAQLALDLCTVKAPLTGVILDRRVQQGQLLAPPASGLLFTIAPGLDTLEVHALVPEGEIGKVRPGQKVSFTVSAYPEDTVEPFTGTVKEIRNPDKNQGATNYDTVIEVENRKDPQGHPFLRPGMTANATITGRHHDNAWKVPAQALSVQMDLEHQTPDAQEKVKALSEVKGPQWKVVWVTGPYSKAPPGKPWPLYVRTGGLNDQKEPGIGDDTSTEVLEWDPEMKPAPKAGEPLNLELITKAPSAHKQTLMERLASKLKF